MACKSGVCSRSKRSQPAVQAAQNLGLNTVPQPEIKTGGFFKGAPAQQVNFGLLTPQQQSVQNSILGRASGMLEGGLGNFNFAPIEEEARAGFFSNTIPTLAERFTAMGGGAQNSSAFQSALGQAGSDLERGLASLKSQYGLQQQGLNQNLLVNLLNAGLGSRSFENTFIPRQASGLENLLIGGLQAGGQAAGKLLGGFLGGFGG